ncbi:uncharacterized protein CLUP02_01495 [Colletotrichum lupini]|uniref:Uncharacterized protein n=1 Tax=Colletotrichum lupini TaxID=145971 RepID=A0A9Q8W8Q9_9PEZI|nr:uncharacterized protein CLUP02_01495 [Colletotrichum lupini]UQC74843.1 hypothetical protein CLUP02_01495 [Colletotrichum lupini]
MALRRQHGYGIAVGHEDARRPSLHIQEKGWKDSFPQSLGRRVVRKIRSESRPQTGGFTENRQIQIVCQYTSGFSQTSLPRKMVSERTTKPITVREQCMSRGSLGWHMGLSFVEVYASGDLTLEVYLELVTFFDVVTSRSRFRSEKLNRISGGVVAENSAPCVFQIPTYTYLHSTIHGRLSSFAFDRRWIWRGGGWEAKAVDEQRGMLEREKKIDPRFFSLDLLSSTPLPIDRQTWGGDRNVLTSMAFGWGCR